MGIALLVISLRRAESFLVRCLLLVLSLEPSLIDTMRGVVSTSFVRSFVFGFVLSYFVLLICLCLSFFYFYNPIPSSQCFNPRGKENRKLAQARRRRRRRHRRVEKGRRRKQEVQAEEQHKEEDQDEKRLPREEAGL